MFFCPSAFQLRCKIDKKASPGRSKIKQQNWSASWSNFWWVLEPTWVDFGRVLVPKLEPFWHQVAPKPDPTTDQKNDHSLEGLRIDFWWILGPNMAPKRRKRNWWNLYFLALGALLAPRWPQEPPKRPQDASKTDFGAIRVDFLLSFC